MKSQDSVEFEYEMYYKLLEAEREAESTKKRYSSEEIRKAIEDILSKK